jgi:uncharacterized membrane protein
MIYIVLPVLAPVLMNAGMETPARLIYRVYSFTCHQLSYRSFFLFGDQVVYPRDPNAQGLATYSQVSGLNSGDSNADLMEARNFLGNSFVGYKIALCQRDVAIYGGIVLFGIIFILSKKRIRQIPVLIWIIFGILPVALDGLSQLLSQSPFNFFDYRESTPFLRSITGFLFGFMTAWFAFPVLEQAMRDTRKVIESKQKPPTVG